MTEADIFSMIADALGVQREKVTKDSVAGDIAEWDSMGTLLLLAQLSSRGVSIVTGETECLQSASGIIAEFQKAGKLQ
ncbi:MAG: hypothetical protein ABSA16_01310 [Thermoguttaceae bacterium]|jgi:acyl carrier protein